MEQVSFVGLAAGGGGAAGGVVQGAGYSQGFSQGFANPGAATSLLGFAPPPASRADGGGAGPGSAAGFIMSAHGGGVQLPFGGRVFPPQPQGAAAAAAQQPGARCGRDLRRCRWCTKSLGVGDAHACCFDSVGWASDSAEKSWQLPALVAAP